MHSDLISPYDTIGLYDCDIHTNTYVHILALSILLNNDNVRQRGGKGEGRIGEGGHFIEQNLDTSDQ